MHNNSSTEVYRNAAPPRGFLCFKRKAEWKEMPDRRVIANVPDRVLLDNAIRTSKYNCLTFIPKNLYLQFSKLANIYFLLIGLLQMVPEISATEGQPLIYVPLALIIAISAIKDLFEDIKRARSDWEENNRKTKVLAASGWVERRWAEVRVGDIVRLEKNEYFPADMLIVATSEAKGVCYIETKNLDGETNLKHKLVPKEAISSFDCDATTLYTRRPIFEYEKPNPYLYQFTGLLILDEAHGGRKIPLDHSNFVLRGCSLRNSEWAHGLVGYNGRDTKIMLNSVKARPKQSKVERTMNRLIMTIFTLQLFVCLMSSLLHVAWVMIYRSRVGYLEWALSAASLQEFLFMFASRFGNWMLLFTNFVPISLLVTLETVKFAQGILITNDETMKSEHTPTNVQSSNLNEELGQLHYIFSDKTGTLTCNLMEFKKISIGGTSYGERRGYKGKAQLPVVTNVDFADEGFFADRDDQSSLNYVKIRQTLVFIALCHTIICEDKDGVVEYNASSPDELALVNWAKQCGCAFNGLDDENRMCILYRGEKLMYQLLHVLEFNSTRKRMSVIVRDPDGFVRVLCKGADSILLARLRSSAPDVKETWNNLESYGVIGLRTLLLAERVVPEDEYLAWAARYSEACTAMNDREKMMMDAQEEIERELLLVGATAIEDKLQDCVGETISELMRAGIRIWVLTGDKIETAINIGFSCKLLNEAQERLIIEGSSLQEVTGALVRASQRQMEVKREGRECALIISGEALIHAMKNDAVASIIVDVGEQCRAVVACRVSPKQKQEVVTLVREHRPEANTLAIGDGANDVNMIIAAHVGVGIKGVEGQQAARAADYSFGEFKHLRRLVLLHGRESYRRNTALILYNFYKNMVLVLPQFWFGFINGFSAQVIYDQFIFQFFNVFYASLPIVLFAILDEEAPAEVVLADVKAYEVGQNDKLFNLTKYWQQIGIGGFQAIGVAFLCFYGLELNFAYSSGGNVHYWVSGLVAFSACVILTNLKVLLFTNTFSILACSVIALSIIFYFVNIYLFGYIEELEVSGLFLQMVRSPVFYLAITILIGATTFVDMAFTRWGDFEDKMVLDEKRSIESREMRDMRVTKLLLGRMLIKQSLTSYTGFAFAQEEPLTKEQMDFKN